MPAMTQAQTGDGGHDLEAVLAWAATEHVRALRHLARNPDSRAARRIVHMSGRHLEELRREVRQAAQDICASGASLEHAVELGRELGRAECGARGQLALVAPIRPDGDGRPVT